MIAQSPYLVGLVARCGSVLRRVIQHSAFVGITVFWVLSTCGCSEPFELPPFQSAAHFSLLTYNVAGLPDGLSSGDPETNIPKISPRLNAFDVVLVQEDFSYQRELRADVEMPFQSLPKEPDLPLGDGLNRFSYSAFDEDLERVRWELCSGIVDGSNDCLAEKGFSIATHRFSPTLLHMDAGGGQEDRDARLNQVEQLIRYLEGNATGRPLIVAGDTNLRPSRESADDASVLAKLYDEANLVDSCALLDCGEEDRIDRILVRAGERADVRITDWRIADEFVDENGDPLSDHEGVVAEIVVEERTP